VIAFSLFRYAVQLLTPSNLLARINGEYTIASLLPELSLIHLNVQPFNVRPSLVHTSQSNYFNPLSPNINMRVLLSVTHMFLMVLVGRICTNIKTVHVW